MDEERKRKGGGKEEEVTIKELGVIAFVEAVKIVETRTQFVSEIFFLNHYSFIAIVSKRNVDEERRRKGGGSNYKGIWTECIC